MHITHVLLTHWGRVTHICVGKLTIIGSDNGLSPGRRQAIIWTNAGILLIGPLGTKFSEILIKIYTFSFKKINLKVSSGKWRPSCLGLNELIRLYLQLSITLAIANAMHICLYVFAVFFSNGRCRRKCLMQGIFEHSGMQLGPANFNKSVTCGMYNGLWLIIPLWNCFY